MTSPFTYSLDDKTMIVQPQSTRWRHRFKGSRESYKLNLEAQQFMYDINRLYDHCIALINKLDTNYDVLYNDTYDPDVVIAYADDITYDATVSGLSSIMDRLENVSDSLDQLGQFNG